MMIWLWLGAIVVFGVVEAFTAGLVSIWFVAGSVAALIAAIAHVSETAQVIVFLIVSAVALAATRPLVRKFVRRRAEPTNLDRVLGEVAKVTERVDNRNSTGAVYVDGKTWPARSADGTVISAGEEGRIEKIEGGKLFVKICEKAEVEK